MVPFVRRERPEADLASRVGPSRTPRLVLEHPPLSRGGVRPANGAVHRRNMTGPSQGPAVAPPGGPAPEGMSAEVGSVGVARPGRPGALRERARAFRQEYARRQTLRRDRVANVVLAALLVVGAYAIVTERPGYLLTTLRSLESSSGPGPPVVVHFGAPSESTVSCSAGGTAYVESLPWDNSTETLATGEVSLRLYEIWDGDNIPDPGAVANATPKNLCEGAPPDATALWYLVLVAPNGTNLLTYTEASSWSSITGGSSDLKIYDGSSLVVVSYDSLAGTGRGIEVVGFAGSSPVSGSAIL